MMRSLHPLSRALSFHIAVSFLCSSNTFSAFSLAASQLFIPELHFSASSDTGMSFSWPPTAPSLHVAVFSELLLHLTSVHLSTCLLRLCSISRLTSGSCFMHSKRVQSQEQKIVRILPFVAIPHHQASGSMNYGIIHAMYYGLFVPSMCWRKLLRNAYKGGLYLRAR